MKRPFCVGLTGGIAAGKSTVANLFAGLGAGVIDTDVIAHDLTAAGGAAMPVIIQAFGHAVADAHGALDRAIMRDMAFHNIQVRTRLEAILHPLILDVAKHDLTVSSTAYVILVVPLLVENLDRYHTLIDRILVVDCDESRQLARASARPGMDEARVHSVLEVQTSRARRLAIADDVIDNNGDLSHMAGQISNLHDSYQRMVESRQ